MSRRVVSEAPHGKAFYALVLSGAVAAGAMFGFASLSDVARAPAGWRAAFGAVALLFLAGGVQAGERIFWPERAMARSAGLGGRMRRRMFKGRMGALALGVVGYLALSGSWVERSEVVEAFCADLRVVMLGLPFLYFCLADLSGERGMTPSSWWYPKKRRRKQTAEAEPLL